MESEYISVTEWAEKYGYQTASVRQMLIAGRLPGFKIGKQWVIASNQEPPEDHRLKK